MLFRRTSRRTQPASSSRYTTRHRNRGRPLSVKVEANDGPRILFCGADAFSIYSLRALRHLQEEQPHTIGGIDVVCRPDKRVGRGLKQIHEVPIKGMAKELDLPLHQIDTFTGWSPPAPVDLVVTVSFGLLVPSRILGLARLGGLNVHPSLLPDLRGPAPIQRALLEGRSYTGVTLQTMHPRRFDHGEILAQTPAPGVPIPEAATSDQLVDVLGPVGARMLRGYIAQGAFSHPPPETHGVNLDVMGCSPASKITPEDRHIDWQTWNIDQISMYDRVLGRLWDNTTYQRCFGNPQPPKRITWHGPWSRAAGTGHFQPDGLQAGQPGLWLETGTSFPVFALQDARGDVVIPGAATIEGEQKGKGLSTLLRGVQSSHA